ncbi:MAG: tRNA dihydrouridine synthase DusB [Omnitrophica bacterium]|nr:tRNA dihydrouridine synthase DusB [Candidatus Omnitrophota bacterium]
MKTNIFLAPMSGVTDLSFRLMCREFGAGHCFFEMLDANALIYNHPGTQRLLATHRKDGPIAAQLLGRDPAVVLEAAERLQSLAEISFLDINCGCPAKKVIKKGAGAYLLKDIGTLCKILKKLTSSLPIPVTVKIRTGFDSRSVAESQNIAKKCEDCGVSKLFIHGRTRSQGYAGDIDYEAIRAVKTVLKIPVFGSGNIFDPISAKRMFDETGCDGILVARGAMGNPWIFRNIDRYLKDGALSPCPTLFEKKTILKKHLSLVQKYKKTRHANKMGFMCKIAMWYLKGLPGATRIRERICSIGTYAKLVGLIDDGT